MKGEIPAWQVSEKMITNYNEYDDLRIPIGMSLPDMSKKEKVSTYYNHTKKTHGITGNEKHTTNPDKADLISCKDL